MKQFTLFLATLTCASALFAQSRITGTVTDSTGAVVAGAKVVAIQTATGITTTSETNASGVYSLAPLAPGAYEITAEMSGFKKFSRTGVSLDTGMAATIDVRLELGQASETISVESSAPLLESESSSVGQLIENKFILNMPIQTRRSASLVRLMGNVSFRSEDGGEAVPKFSMAGGRSQNQMWALDGGVTQNMALGVAQLSLNPPNEALQEFKATSNNYSAELGRTGGGYIAMTTKSGTNEFHGSLYEWLRNDKLNARTFFAPTKAPLRYNIFGGSIGGPIRKNKTFFFYNFEGGRRRTGVTVTRTVPHAGEAQGDFSRRTDFTILDPSTRVGTGAAQPFPGNRIPASRLDPIGAQIAAFYPAANVASANVTRRAGANYFANGSDKLNQNYHTLRVDHELTTKDRIFGRLAYVTAPEEIAAVFPNAAVDDRAGPRENRHNNILLSWQRSIKPTLINEFKYMYGNRLHINRGAGTGSNLNGSLGINGVNPEVFARFNVNGYSPLGQGNHERIQDPILTHQFNDNLIIIKGNHNIKTGFEFRYSGNIDDFNGTTGGLFGFNNRATNDALAELLLGWTTTAQLVDTDILHARTDYYGAYIQDDWKVTSRLTLNLGVRWEMDTPRWEKNNRQSGFDGSAINPVSGRPGVITFAGINGVSRYAHGFDKNNWGPRVGFAYRAATNFVVRGGYGISYNGTYQGAVPNSFNQGFAINGSFSSPNGGFAPVFMLRDGMPPIARPELGPGFGSVPVGRPVTNSPDFVQQNMVSGYAQQWNLTLQKSIGSILLEGAYIANVGHKLGGPNVNINQIPLVNGRGPASQSQAARPFPHFNNVVQVSPPWGNSTYHSMNLKFEKRYARGLSFLGNYTWSKFLDDVESGSELGGAANNGYTHIEARRLNKGLSGSDIRHRVTYSTLYDLPFGKGRQFNIENSVLNAIAGGWTIGGILEARTGASWGVVEQTNRLNTFSDAQRPNLIRDPIISGDRSRGEMLAMFFDTSAFTQPGVGELGTAGKTSGSGPNFFGLDLSIQKEFRFTERVGLTFRTDIVNAPNIPVFGLPNLSRGAGAFGTINSIQGGSTAREIQMSLRLAF
ncbi:MAG: TonB-dependent receptor [Bryobacter sp.]|nr:TonB-dependent receptor [Bryobacter sp.]